MLVMSDRHFPETISICCPLALVDALDLVADRHLTSPSEYARRALIDRLRADDVDPVQLQWEAR